MTTAIDEKVSDERVRELIAAQCEAFTYDGDIASALRDLLRLRSEVEGLRQNDARYRWLRDGEVTLTLDGRAVDVVALPKEDGDEYRTMGMYELDAALDSALVAKAGKGEG